MCENNVISIMSERSDQYLRSVRTSASKCPPLLDGAGRGSLNTATGFRLEQNSRNNRGQGSAMRCLGMWSAYSQ